MTKNPLINAVSALAYIVVVAEVMNYVSHLENEPETIIGPIAFLSLFTLSATVMGYLFLGQPLQMFLSGEKKEGATLFLQTLAAFAGLTVVVLIVFLSGLGR